MFMVANVEYDGEEAEEEEEEEGDDEVGMEEVEMEGVGGWEAVPPSEEWP